MKKTNIINLISGPILISSLFLSINLKAVEPLPLLDSLSLEQQKIYHRASPSGQDLQQVSPEVSQPVSTLDTARTLNSIPSEIEKNIAEKLTTISLEEKIKKQVIQPTLEQFGYDLFSNVPTTFVPVTNIPVPPDYTIGP